MSIEYNVQFATKSKQMAPINNMLLDGYLQSEYYK